MTYNSIANMVDSYALIRRVNAAAATEDIPLPVSWVDLHKWELCASPGWSEAWDSAVANGDPDPGADEAVITDGMILSAVQAVAAEAGE